MSTRRQTYCTHAEMQSAELGAMLTGARIESVSYDRANERCHIAAGTPEPGPHRVRLSIERDEEGNGPGSVMILDAQPITATGAAPLYLYTVESRDRDADGDAIVSGAVWARDPLDACELVALNQRHAAQDCESFRVYLIEHDRSHTRGIVPAFAVAKYERAAGGFAERAG